MPKDGYFWGNEETRNLTKLWNSGERSIDLLASHVGRKPEAVRKKLQRMGLLVVGQNTCRGTTTKGASDNGRPEYDSKRTRIELKVPDELMSVEDALKLLAAALESLRAPGLSHLERERLKLLVYSVRTYQKLFADYIEYRKIEEHLIELERKYQAIVSQRGVPVVKPPPAEASLGQSPGVQD